MDRRHVHLFYRDEYVYDVLEAGLRHTFDVLRSRRVRDGLVSAGLATAPDFHAACAFRRPARPEQSLAGRPLVQT